MDRKHQILAKYFGYSEFRGGQEELINAQLRGQDVLGIMPTGGGKSLCYQIPALLLDGITLVISPLISLMKDQVMALKNAGIPAAFVNSSLSNEQIQKVFAYIADGKYKLIYVAPERLESEGFLWALRSVRVSLLAVDEAHCISQWGQDFRPSYLRIVNFLDALGYRPIVSAFTATATERVRSDISQILSLRDPLCIVTGFDRPNLRFEVRKPKNKSAEIFDLVRKRDGKSGIIYCSTRKNVEQVCELLQSKGIRATRYHAGLSDEERRDNQDSFLYDQSRVMVATNAFGMGIDKSNVSYVIHYNMPQSMEAYYQEAGRAGRDGAAADCILLYSGRDVATAKFLIQQPAENDALDREEQERVQALNFRRLWKMVGYCQTDLCLRAYILEYFGQEHPMQCGNCGNCDGNVVERDITTQAKMILSCVKRIEDKLGYSMGPAAVVRVLRGSKDKRLLQLGLDGLSTYGLMSSTDRDSLNDMVQVLISRKYLSVSDIHGGITLTDKAKDVLFHDERVKMIEHVGEDAEKPRISKPVDIGREDGDLLAVLKTLRNRIAADEQIPAYIIFSNATLIDMAAKAPKTMAAFLRVSGVGTYKARRYGRIFLDEIKRYYSE